jgi:hypothetical protein
VGDSPPIVLAIIPRVIFSGIRIRVIRVRVRVRIRVTAFSISVHN